MPRTGCPSSFRPSDADGATLLKILGIRRLAALQAVLGGRRIWIPKAGVNFRCSVCARRDDCIRAMRRSGTPVEAISRRLGVSAKTIYRVLRAKRPR